MRLLLVLLLFGCADPDRKTVGPIDREQLPPRMLLQPLGEVDPANIDSAAAAVARAYRTTVQVAQRRELPASAYTTIRSPRYRADSLIAWLRAIKPEGVDHIIGLTSQDISITKYDSTGATKDPAWKYRDFGIFGLGFIDGPSCVVSTFRLGDEKSPRFFARLKKITVHEVGHNRGLPHCADPTCVMRDAVERMGSIDAVSGAFCAACKKRLRAL